jgi:hypothetical protein
MTSTAENTVPVGATTSPRWTCSRCGAPSPSPTERTIDPRFAFGRCLNCRQRTIHITEGVRRVSPQGGR